MRTAPVRTLLSSARRTALLALLGVAVSACAADVASLVSRADLVQTDVVGGAFRHRVYEQRGAGDTLFLFLDGDGRPWVDGGQQPASDPTPPRPLGLQLMLGTPAPAFYVGRPCYLGIEDPACSPHYWTHGRFAPIVVDSVRRAVDQLLERANKPHCVLVGHSGGATLALLIAPDLARPCALVTVAGLIDSAAWTEWHGFEPLTGSLNAADSIGRWRNLTQVHLVGLADVNIPHAQTTRALRELAATTVVEFPTFDHGCCWQRQWTAILAAIEPRLHEGSAVRRTAAASSSPSPSR